MTHTFSRAKATLNSLNRALAAVPYHSELPDVEFIFSSEDYVDGTGPIWSYSKREDNDWTWLMPDFGYWSWPEAMVGSYRNVRQRIAAIDEGTISGGEVRPGLRFQDKIKQLLWRGNIDTNPELRGSLLNATREKSWASVRSIDWADEANLRQNYVPIEDHCRYMFLGHVEGRSYSGRGKYLQNCRSVFVSHQLEWREAHHAALLSSGFEANYVKVNRDFSDLETKIHQLLDEPEVAERIAENSIRTFRDRYLTPAAEACYWRELISAYGSVFDFAPVLETGAMGRVPRGVPFESFILLGKLP
jgi:Glycosyl transferase family 90